jgi:hypothetical protein
LTYRELPHTVPTLTAHTKFETEPFYLNVAEIDPQKSWNAMSDFRFANVATSAGRCKSDQDWVHAKGEQCVDRL